MLGLISRSFKCRDDSMFKSEYKSMGRPHAEYIASVCSRYKIDEVKLVEGVQRRATRLVLALWDLSYDERLKQLSLPALEYWRYRSYTLQVYKIMSNKEDIPYTNFLKACETCLWVVVSWNHIPEGIVSAPGVNSFKSHLESHRIRWEQILSCVVSLGGMSNPLHMWCTNIYCS